MVENQPEVKLAAWSLVADGWHTSYLRASFVVAWLEKQDALSGRRVVSACHSFAERAAGNAVLREVSHLCNSHLESYGSGVVRLMDGHSSAEYEDSVAPDGASHSDSQS